MKEYKFNLNGNYIERFFSPVRDKVGIIQILIECIKYMILNPSVIEDNVKGKIILRVEKMSRLFFFTEDKFFSINFPFFVKKVDEGYCFSSNYISNIGNTAKLAQELQTASLCHHSFALSSCFCVAPKGR
ncbi:MAG: hypothetical protein D3923_05010, partial [Candidatus Electrothrix sp. AR3]|nr:hypothetical protein [Candidatus Electrothrix sp. AR3]